MTNRIQIEYHHNHISMLKNPMLIVLMAILLAFKKGWNINFNQFLRLHQESLFHRFIICFGFLVYLEEAFSLLLNAKKFVVMLNIFLKRKPHAIFKQQ